MTPLQKKLCQEVYKKNAALFKTIQKQSNSSSASSSLLNVLAAIRRILGHPYLQSGVEMLFKSKKEEHRGLVEASAKLQFLQVLLRKLKQRNCRVLIFTQYKKILDILEDFMDGEEYPYLRIVGGRDRIGWAGSC
jgi:chromodomain-helicase-DNA-binding protein 4